jgi:hypothetical protein
MIGDFTRRVDVLQPIGSHQRGAHEMIGRALGTWWDVNEEDELLSPIQ